MDRAVEAHHLRVRGVDEVVLIRYVRAVPMSETEVPGRQLEERAGENIPGPGTGVPRPEERLEAIAPVDVQLRADDRGGVSGKGGVGPCGR